MNISEKSIIGTWQTLYSPEISEILCDMGFSFVTIDLEHSPMDLSHAARLIQVIILKGKTALVRLGSHDENIIKRVMDMGATGVIIANIKTAEDAEKIVKAAKYPPFGTRGVGLSRAQKYGEGFEEYLKWNAESGIVIAQIEHIDAIANIEEILSVKGLSGTMIGPYDLSGSMGYPGEFQREDVKEAVGRYLEACKKLNHPPGYHVVSSDSKDLIPYIEAGYKFLPFGFDAKFMIDMCKSSLSGVNAYLEGKSGV